MTAKSAIPYAALFENSDDPIVFFNPEGVLVDANVAAYEATGWDAEMADVITFAEQFCEDDRSTARSAFARTLLGTRENHEFTLDATPGRRAIPIESHFFPATDADGAIVGVFETFRDLSLSALSEKLLFANHERFRSLFEHNPDPVMFIRIDGTLDRVNAMFEDFMRMPGENIINKHWTSLLDPGAREEGSEIFERALGGEAQEFEALLRPELSESAIPVRIKHIPLWVNEEVLGTSAVIKNITAERIAYEHMHNLAFHDPLTGLPNRALFGDRLDQMIASAKRYNRPFAVLFLDLDGFKGVNDQHGHAAGDELLHAFGKRLSELLRESDTFARLGGDEFAVLQPLVTIPADAETLARKLLAGVRDPFAIAAGAISIGLSIGVSVFPWDGAESKTLLQGADRALYEAKAAGKNTFRMATSL